MSVQHALVLVQVTACRPFDTMLCCAVLCCAVLCLTLFTCLPHSQKAMTDAMQAPMCTNGPSVPTVRLAAQLKMDPTNLVIRV